MAFEGFLGARPVQRRVGPLGVSVVLHAVALLALALRGAAVPTAPVRPAPDASFAASATVTVPVRIAGSRYAFDPRPPRPSSTPPAGRGVEPRAPGRGSPAVAGRAVGRSRRPIGTLQAPLRQLQPATPLPPSPVEPPPIEVPSITPLPAAAAPPTRVAAVATSVPSSVAQGLRVYETYPRLPSELLLHGRRYPVQVQICVGTDGAVRDVHLERGAAPKLDALVLSAIRTWRYRPHQVDGASRPFCHQMRIVYSAG